jgi:4,5-DOPA dioxygenase extradiol
VHAFPDASIPVVQLSINADKPFDYHLRLGAKLAPLRESGVLIVGSGNIVHNLRGMDWNRVDEGFDWARRFDTAAQERILSDPAELASLDAHPDFAAAVPTPDHFIPALYFAGLSGAAEGSDAGLLVDGYAYGSLSMTAYTLDLACPASENDTGSPAVAADAPPDASNI